RELFECWRGHRRRVTSSAEATSELLTLRCVARRPPLQVPRYARHDEGSVLLLQRNDRPHPLPQRPHAVHGGGGGGEGGQARNPVLQRGAADVGVVEERL